MEHETISRHRTKVAALRGWKRAKAEAETWYETDEHATLLYYVDPETCVTSFFREDDYAVCSVNLVGECQLCQQRERPCYDRYADGRCRRLAYAAKGPWRVYALIDPRDGRTRYIGSTEKSLPKRLSGHLSAREGARGAWIDDLLASGLKPVIREITQFGTWLEALTHEYQLINSLAALTNGQKTHSAVTRAIETTATDNTN